MFITEKDLGKYIIKAYNEGLQGNFCNINEILEEIKKISVVGTNVIGESVVEFAFCEDANYTNEVIIQN